MTEKVNNDNSQPNNNDRQRGGRNDGEYRRRNDDRSGRGGSSYGGRRHDDRDRDRVDHYDGRRGGGGDGGRRDRRSNRRQNYRSDRRPDRRQNRSDRNDRYDRRDRGSRDDRNDNRQGNRRNNRPSRDEEQVKEVEMAQIEAKNENFNLPDSIDDFEDMEFLPDELTLSINEYGFKYPSQVQSKSIHIINAGHDMIVQSASGTGKTGAFTIGALSRINPDMCSPQVIIVANAHPLANQIYAVVRRLAAHMGIKVCICIGRSGMKPEKNAEVASRSHILVGTPGRLRDICGRNVFDPQDIKVMVMDEADELLKDEFYDDIRDIIEYHISENTQICSFSATYTKTSYTTARAIMKNPYEVVIQQEKLSTDRIFQFKVMIEPSPDSRNSRYRWRDIEDGKLDTLVDLASSLSVNQAIIFTNHKNGAMRIRDELMRAGFQSTGMVTSDSDHETREKILCQFRLCQIKFLISTDMISRGIDIDDLRCVINFDMPKSSETYIHRIGRSGRYGGQGVAINLMTYDDAYLLTELRSDYGINIDDLPKIDEINHVLTNFDPPEGKASASQIYEGNKIAF